GDSGTAAAAETRASWIVPACLNELKAAADGKSVLIPPTPLGEMFPADGQVYGIAFTAGGQALGPVDQANYASGLKRMNDQDVRYITKLEGEVLAAKPGSAWEKVQTRILHKDSMSRRRHQSSGFTLIELLVSMAIGTAVLLMAVSVLGRTGDGYDRIGGGVSAEREARAVLSQVSSDLTTARFNKDQVFEKGASGWIKDRIGFLALQPADAQSTEGRIGDLCAVHYYVKDLETEGRIVRCLMRGFRESAETFDAVKGGSIAPLFVPRDRDEPIAFGVVSFEARPRTRDETGNWQDWNVGQSTYPQAIELKLILARRDLSGKLSTAADWDGLGTTGKLLGTPEEASRNRSLETFGSLIRFGNDEVR
ncbi:MAG: hypothetical protein CFE26_21105, partial [Verrucomicrobiales bacterium VVV1]